MGKSEETVEAQKRFFGKLADSFTYLRNERRAKKEHRSNAKALAAEKDQLQKDEETYKDNLHILANHDAIVTDQRMKIRKAQGKREQLQSELAVLEAAAMAAAATLQRTKSERDKEIEPHQERYDDISEKISDIEDDIRSLESDKRNLESERHGASDSQLRSLDARIDAIDERIKDKEERVGDLKDQLHDIDDYMREIEDKHAGGIATATAAATAASAKVADTAKRISDETKKIKNARARVERCGYVVSHPEETPELKQKIDRDSATIVEHECELAALEEQLSTLGAGSKLAKRFLLVCAGALLVAIVAICLVLSGALMPSTTSSATHPSRSSQQAASQASSKPSANSSERTDQKTSDNEDTANPAASHEADADSAPVDVDTSSGGADASSSDEYVLPASDSEYYTRDQLEGLSDWELYVARNEVFARYGRQFKNEDLADYFSSQPWYNGEYSPEDFDDWFSPNEYEKANTDLIMEIEHERNSPYLN